MIKILFLTMFVSKFCFANQGIEEFIFNKPDPGVRTEALVIAKNGEIKFQKYIHGNAATRHLLWSMSKSISSLIFGVAESKGYISREDSIYKYFKEEIDLLDKHHANDLKKIRIRDFLGMASGLYWNEYYEEAPFSSDVVRMLYFETKYSMVNYVLKTPVRYPPGTRFHYSSGDTNVVMGALQRALPKELQKSYPWDFFFNPMQMNATFETDAQGVFVGSSYVYLTTGDLLKLGELIMNKGQFQGQQVVPESYLEYALGLNDPMLTGGRCLIDSYMSYGAQFWLNHKCPNGKKPFADAPDNLVMLLGHGGQSVFIFPDERIVAVRIASDDEQALDKNKYSKLILEAYAK